MTRITVGTGDLRAALLSVKPHTAAPSDASTPLEWIHCRVEGNNLLVMATDRYSAGLAIVSVLENDDQAGVPFELSRQEVAELLLAFKPGKGDLDASVRIEQKSPDGDLTVTDVSGLWPGKSIAYPRSSGGDDDFPDLALVFAGLVEEPVAATVDEFIVAGQRLAAFKAASSAYSKPLVLEPRGRSLIISAGDSFLGFLAPITESDEDRTQRHGWRADWRRRLARAQASAPDLRRTTGAWLHVVRDGAPDGVLEVLNVLDDQDSLGEDEL